MNVSRLFAYGTLRDDAVVRGLLGHPLFGRPAVLKGYRREIDAVIGYPVIHADEAATVPGTLFDGVDADALEILDGYEGAHYRRVVVEVVTVDGRVLEAYAYVPVAP